jgi:regulator of cell morphogenesis and NO signaling
MEKINYNNTMLGEIVTEDFRAAEIFKEAGIDFCCGGKKTLTEACREKKLDVNAIASKLEDLHTQPHNSNQNFKDWSLDFLADYIMNTHHKFVLKTLPDLVFYTQKIAQVHGENHPELVKIAAMTAEINTELLQHLKNEEEVLFPAIKIALKSDSTEARLSIQAEIARMSDEHEYAGGAMDTINVMTQGYTLPQDACNTYKVAFKLLEQFEDDLHVHVHLENNILYPKALNL